MWGPKMFDFRRATVFLDFKQEYAFLEPLIEFLAILVQKLGQKTANW